MCNNNGECRKHVANVMCPSFRVTGNERDVTRGRANSLRLAISGQLGPDAFASDEMLETMKLCVSCKGCRRECPTGVDMAKMKIEVLAAANARRGLSLHDRLVAYLPRYAPYAARLAPLMNARDAIPGAGLADRAAHRLLRQAPAAALAPRSCSPPSPRIHGERVGVRGRPHTPAHVAAPHPNPLPAEGSGGEGTREVALFADTFNTYFEPENLHDAVEVLTRLGYRVTVLLADDGGRPLCCGRTFLSAGLVEEARAEARRAAGRRRAARRARRSHRRPGAVLPAHAARRVRRHAARCRGRAPGLARGLLFEEFLAREAAAGRIPEPIAERTGKVLLHGHCHQKAFGAMGAVERRWASSRAGGRDGGDRAAAAWPAPSATAPTPTRSPCAMGELSLLPAVRKAAPDDAHRRRRLLLPPPDPATAPAARRHVAHVCPHADGRLGRSSTLSTPADAARPPAARDLRVKRDPFDTNVDVRNGGRSRRPNR